MSARRRLMAGTGTTAVFVAALGAFGSPAWAEPHPDVADRPPVTAPFSPQTAIPSGSGTYPSPPVADANQLERTIRVAPFDKPRSREYFAVSPEPVDRELIDKVRKIDGVQSVEVVDAARIKVDGVTMSVLGVNPSTFRNYAPLPSAKSDEIWQGIAEGRIALSNDAGTQRDLALGSTVAMAGAWGTVDKEVWTHATSGVAGIDALISRSSAAELGFPRGNGLIVSAPGADLWQLREDLNKVLGPDISLQVLAEEDPGPRRYDAEGVPVSEEVIEKVIAAAESQLGVPYVWGGTTPGKGFDCSGLVQWAFRQAGVEIPRVTHDQWWAGQHLDYSAARRGDLLFWRTDPTAPDYISHVAIYLGDGKMLEAPRSGDVVKITDVRLEKMAGVVRVHVAE